MTVVYVAIEPLRDERRSELESWNGADEGPATVAWHHSVAAQRMLLLMERSDERSMMCMGPKMATASKSREGNSINDAGAECRWIFRASSRRVKEQAPGARQVGSLSQRSERRGR